MLWAIIVSFLALSWLLQRFYTLTRVPVDDLVKILKIEIPKASKISIDNITNDKAYLHWDLPSIEQKIVNFIVYLNGTQVSLLSGTESHVCLQNLESNTSYKLDLVCVNNLGYKAKSDSVYIKTKSDDLEFKINKVLLENPDTLFKYLTEKDSLNVEKLITPFSVNPNVEGRSSRSRSNTVNSLNENNITSNTSTYAELLDPKSIDDIEELRYHLESGQEELHTILGQQSQIYQDFKDYEATLIQERDFLRERKKLEDGSRQSMKNEIKMLDETRRLTELRKSKQEKLLSDKMKSIEKMESDLKLWNEKIDEFQEKKDEIEKNDPIIQKEIEIDIELKKLKIKECNSEISELDDKIKYLNAQKKQQENLSSFTKLFKKLSTHTDDQGSVDNEGIKALEAMKLLNIDVYNKVKDSISTDNKLEAEWRAQQQREVNRCQKLAEIYKNLKTENQLIKDGNYQPNNIPIPQYNNKSNNNSFHLSSPPPSINNFNYNFKSDSSPSINSTTINQSNNSFNSIQQSSSIWNRENNINKSNNNIPLLRTNNLNNFQSSNEIESPSVDHYLPTNLITEDLSDLLLNKNRDSNILTESSTPSQEDHFQTSINYTINDSNLSSKSIFQAASHQQSQPLFNPTSPQLSFQTDFFGIHSSPNTSLNAPVNDINSIISNINQNDILKLTSPQASQNQSPAALKTVNLDESVDSERKETSLNAFSPRRLSNVFNFGRKNTDTNNTNNNNNNNNNTNHTINNQSSSASKLLQQSKFFNNHNKNSHSIDSTTESHNNHPFFSFNNNNGSKKSVIEDSDKNNDEFLNSVWETQGLKLHTRNVSLHSGKSLEKDNASWFKFHNNSIDESTNHHHQNSTSSTSNDQNDLLLPVELTNTNKSANTMSTKSVKSITDSSVSSPSFFRRKSFFSFGKDSTEKSPIKAAPSPIPQIEIESEHAVEDNSTATSTPIKMFSRSNKRTLSQNRKQSNSSSFQDSQNESFHENSSNNSARSGSIVKKLNFFKNGKEINDIDEAVEDD